MLDDPREALRLGYRFDSFAERYRAMFAIARRQLDLPVAAVEDWLALPAAARRAHFAAADLRASAALLLLEQAALRRQQLLALDELKRRHLDRRHGAAPQAERTFARLLAESGFLSRPAELLDGGYGLPQAEELQALERASQARQQRLQALGERLDGQLRALLDPPRRVELDGGAANLAALGEQLRTLHRSEGGLRLP